MKIGMLGLCTLLLLAVRPGAADPAGVLLQARLDRAEVEASPLVPRDKGADASVRQLYLNNGFGLLWSAPETGLTPKAAELLTLLETSDLPLAELPRLPTAHLVPLLAQAEAQWAASGSLDPALRMELDWQLTAAAQGYLRAQLQGQWSRPERIAPDWRSAPEALDARLQQALASAAPLAESWAALAPNHPGFARLYTAWQDYRAQAAVVQWPPLSKTVLEDPLAQAEQLQARLQWLGDWPADPSLSLEAALETALSRFQRRHGLSATGRLDPATLTALNVPLAERARQMALNLERWRWLPQELGDRYILVNIPAFHLEVVARGETVLEMPVIVGKPKSRTPLLSSMMTYLVLSPSWTVPPSIAGQEIGVKGMHKFQVAGAVGEGGDLGAALRSGQVRLRQPPGPKNPLGGVKFMFANPFSVYLHDTSSRGLFTRSQRGLSHGCVRIGKPLDLAAYLLADQPRWTREAIDKAMRRTKEQYVNLKQPIGVHLAYWTAWVDADHQVQFRPDIYGVDQQLLTALKPAAPGRKKKTASNE